MNECLMTEENFMAFIFGLGIGVVILLPFFIAFGRK